MIFQWTLNKVLSGEKTRTSRLLTRGDVAFCDNHDDDVLVMVTNNNARIKWEVGHTYAVQPGRGKKSIARIEIVNIRREDVRKISDADIRAEGFTAENIAEADLDFREIWASMHDKSFHFHRDKERWQWDGTWAYTENGVEQLADTVVALYAFRARPAEFYQAWVLDFKLVQP